jgi:uncharacterized protein
LPSGVTALCDAGPLVALFDPDDSSHEKCKSALSVWRGQIATTWPVLTEAFYFLCRKEHREPLWEMILRGGLLIEDLLPADLQRMRGAMQQYADLPMDVADASLLVAGERLKLRSVFTLDRHFRIYRPRHLRSFSIFP